MAVTFVGSDSAQRGAGTSALTLTLPSHSTDDIGVIVIYNDQDLGTHSISGATGWTQLVDTLTSSGRDMHTSVWYKVFTSGSETNPQCNSTANEELSCSVHVFRGADTVYTPKLTVATDDNIAEPDETDVPGNITTDFDNACGIRAMCITHDDITSVGTPSGYTDGEAIFGGSVDFRQQTVAYDLDLGTAGSKSAPTFSHVLNNNVGEYHTYFIVLEEDQPIHLTDVGGDEKFNPGDTNIIATGDGFESTQGTGILELVENSDYTGTKVTQTIDSWSDTSIQFDVVQGALNEGTVYCFVTNDSGDRTLGVPIQFGFGAYDLSTMTNAPDHYWRMDNSYDDTGAQSGSTNRPFNVAQVGSPDFLSTPITLENTHSFRMKDLDDRSEVADSPYTNITNQHQRRRIGGWFQVDSVQLLPAAIYEEGGGVNNIYMILGYGNILLGNIADSNATPTFKVQAYSDFKLALNRPYHIMVCFDGDGDGDEFYMLIDGVRQTVTDGNPIDGPDHSTHSGDWAFGDPDGNLDTGGTDIGYACCTTMLLAHWGTWSEIGDGIPSDATIRTEVFEAGALADDIITSGTASAMQTALEAFDDTTRDDWPMSFQIPSPTGENDLDLTATNIVFPERISCHIRWLGTGTLTWRNSGTSNASIVSTPNGGTVTFIETASVAVNVSDINTGAAILGARVLVTADSGGPLPSEESVTITRSGSTATVTHTAHGMTRDDQEVLISGANQEEYNGIHAITITSANAYTYTVSGTPTTPATGTITGTAVIISGTTDASGDISSEIDYTSNQPITGKVRKQTTSTFYKAGVLAGSIPSTGLSSSVLLIPDE